MATHDRSGVKQVIGSPTGPLCTSQDHVHDTRQRRSHVSGARTQLAPELVAIIEAIADTLAIREHERMKAESRK